MTYGKMIREPLFEERMRAADAEVWQKMMAMGAGVKYSQLAAFAEKGMDMLSWVDCWANAMSMTALYNIQWKRMEKEARAAGIKLDEDIAHAECMRIVTRVMDGAAQPMLQSQKALVQACGGAGVFGKMAFYMSTEALNKVGLIVRNFRRAGGGGLRASERQ